MKVRIYQPSKSTMQSGRAKTHHWVVEPELDTPRQPEALMGWSSSGDTLNQIRLRFASREDALAFVKRKGWDALVQDSNPRRVKPRSYADNFRPDRTRGLFVY